MGSWGFGVREDDFVLDVIGVFEDALKAGQSLREASEAAQSQFAAALADTDDAALFWIAMAEMQWTYGKLEQSIHDRVRDDFYSGRSLAAWTESDDGLARRRAALEAFLDKIGKPNARPKKLPKLVVRPPKFLAGDCLSIRLSNGQYSAALVLVADHTHAEHGRNLIGALDYVDDEKPTIAVFRERKWLVLHDHDARPLDTAWYYSTGFRAVKDRLEKVGAVEILASDPVDSNFYRPWKGLGERALEK